MFFLQLFDIIEKIRGGVNVPIGIFTGRPACGRSIFSPHTQLVQPYATPCGGGLFLLSRVHEAWGCCLERFNFHFL